MTCISRAVILITKVFDYKKSVAANLHSVQSQKCRIFAVSLNQSLYNLIMTENNQNIIREFHSILAMKYPYVNHENWLKLQDISIVKNIGKNELIFRAGDYLNYGIFVVEGCLKLFYFDENGLERISTFTTKHEYIDNWNDIHQNRPLPYSISALTPSTIILYPLEKMIEIFKQEADLLQLCIDLSQQIIQKKQEHYTVLTLKTPLERYSYLLKRRKEWISDISVTNIAQYLHLSRETVSRVRNKIVKG